MKELTFSNFNYVPLRCHDVPNINTFWMIGRLIINTNYRLTSTSTDAVAFLIKKYRLFVWQWCHSQKHSFSLQLYHKNADL